MSEGLLGRRGRLQSVEDDGETKIIRAVVPLARLFGYAIDLRLRTLGQGTHSMGSTRTHRISGEIKDAAIRWWARR